MAPVQIADTDAPSWFPLRWQLDSADVCCGPHGLAPLPWWSGGWYRDSLRTQVLMMRRQPSLAIPAKPLETLIETLRACDRYHGLEGLVLVPIPSGHAHGLSRTRAQPFRSRQSLSGLQTALLSHR